MLVNGKYAMIRVYWMKQTDEVNKQTQLRAITEDNYTCWEYSKIFLHDVHMIFFSGQSLKSYYLKGLQKFKERSKSSKLRSQKNL